MSDPGARHARHPQPLEALRDAQTPNGNGTGRLLTAEALADRWQIQTSHVYRLTRERRLPAVRLGRYYRYREDAVERFELEGGTDV